MKKSIFCLFLFFSFGAAVAQHTEWRTGVRDTSYTSRSDYAKNVKIYPGISLVPDSPVSDVAEQRNLVYARIGKRELHIDAFTPRGVAGSVPAILIVHGGGWRSGDRTQHIPLAQHLAARGIACFTVEYRLSTEAFYPAAVYDLKAAVRWLRANASRFGIDPMKISVLGFSAGGQLAALIGVTDGMKKFEGSEGNAAVSSDVNAVIDIDGTLSFVHPEASETQNPDKVGASAWWLGYPRTERLDLWTEASPLTYAESNRTPFLFLNSSVARMHAGRDDFKKIMDDHHVYTKIVEFPNTPHSFCLYEPWFPRVVDDIVYFVRRVDRLDAPAVSDAGSNDFIPLWPAGRIPNSKHLALKDSIANERIYRVMVPGMYAYFPGKQENQGAAVVICPGGGYQHLAYVISGLELAKWFNTMGMSAFVLNYRLPNSPDLVRRETGPLMDAQRAIRYIRANAERWGIDPAKVGILGSSSGGHLAASASVIGEDVSRIGDSIDNYAFRPDFTILVSPVIDMSTSYAHAGSVRNLLGPDPTDSLRRKFSLQLQVTPDAPPAFIADAINDRTVNPMNSLWFYEALLKNHVSASFHVFPQGGHSIALRNNPGSAQLWTRLCEAWLNEMGIISDL